jgi:hypothetical protein
MGELEKELRKISMTLSDLARKLDQVATTSGRKTKVAATATRKPSKQARGGKSAPDVIMSIIKAKKSGVRTSAIRAKTGFGSQKVRSVIYELSKKGKIQRVDRGLYRTAQ